MSYKVLVPCVIARDQGGHSHHYYEGAVIPWLDKDQASRWLDEEQVAKLAAGPRDEPAAEPADDGGKPGADAHKPELVEWVYANVAKEDGSDYTKTELRDKSPEELRAIVDSVE